MSMRDKGGSELWWTDINWNIPYLHGTTEWYMPRVSWITCTAYELTTNLYTKVKDYLFFIFYLSIFDKKYKKH